MRRGLGQWRYSLVNPIVRPSAHFILGIITMGSNGKQQPQQIKVNKYSGWPLHKYYFEKLKYNILYLSFRAFQCYCDRVGRAEERARQM